jgi:hypothetical protein
LSLPCISLVVPSELVFDDDGADVDSGKEPIQKIVPILSIKTSMEKYSKASIHFLCSSLCGQFNCRILSLTCNYKRRKGRRSAFPNIRLPKKYGLL